MPPEHPDGNDANRAPVCVKCGRRDPPEGPTMVHEYPSKPDHCDRCGDEVLHYYKCRRCHRVVCYQCRTMGTPTNLPD